MFFCLTVFSLNHELEACVCSVCCVHVLYVCSVLHVCSLCVCGIQILYLIPSLTIHEYISHVLHVNLSFHLVISSLCPGGGK